MGSAWARPLFLAIAIAAIASPALAQAPLGPLDAETYCSGWLWREVVRGSDGTQSQGWGGRGICALGIGRVGITVRGDVGGLPQRFDLNDPATFTSGQAFIALHANLYGTKDVVLGPTAFLGKAISLEAGPSSAPTVGPFTLGVGIRGSAGGGVFIVAIGTHEALGGLCAVGTVHLPLTSRLAVVADGAVSASGRSYVRLGMAVAVANGGQ